MRIQDASSLGSGAWLLVLWSRSVFVGMWKMNRYKEAIYSRCIIDFQYGHWCGIAHFLIVALRFSFCICIGFCAFFFFLGFRVFGLKFCFTQTHHAHTHTPTDLLISLWMRVCVFWNAKHNKVGDSTRLFKCSASCECVIFFHGFAFLIVWDWNKPGK